MNKKTRRDDYQVQIRKWDMNRLFSPIACDLCFSCGLFFQKNTQGSLWRLGVGIKVFLCYECQCKRADMVEQHLLTGKSVPTLPNPALGAR